MFVNAIDCVDPFTRPIHSILRLFGHDEIVPGSATLFFVNEQACAVTCKHVAELIANSDAIFGQYNAFRAILSHKRGSSSVVLRQREVSLISEEAVLTMTVTQFREPFLLAA